MKPRKLNVPGRSKDTFGFLLNAYMRLYEKLSGRDLGYEEWLDEQKIWQKYVSDMEEMSDRGELDSFGEPKKSS